MINAVTKILGRCNPGSLGWFLLVLIWVSPVAAQQLTPEQQKAADMSMPKLDRSELQPERRTPVEVLEGERNPLGFIGGAPPQGKQAAGAPAAETEEQKLRRVLSNMRISGFSGSPGSYSVLLGPMNIREGDVLPRLFFNQAEMLRVDSITDRKVTLAFIEKEKDKPPRTLQLGFNLRAGVQSFLVGDTFSKVVPFDAQGKPNVDALSSAGVERVLSGLEAQGKQSLVERSFDLMGDTTAKPPDEKGKHADE